MAENPFTVKKPDDIDADYVAKYFVDTFTDFARISNHENTFIHGARGTGKSMMLRGLDLGVMRARGTPIKKLPHIGIHIPLKMADFSLGDFGQLHQTAAAAIGEHILVMYVIYHFADTMARELAENSGDDVRHFSSFFEESYRDCGGKLHLDPTENARSVFTQIRNIAAREFSGAIRYVKSLFVGQQVYQGALCGFRDLLLPLLQEFRHLSFVPNIPIFLMIDDADNLRKSMQRILNTWVSMRTYPSVCLKITTQLGYATYRTVDHRIIEVPHDFSEVNINSLYLNENATFTRRIREIVSKRLEVAEIECSPEDFFPEDEKQSLRLKEIADQLRKEWADRRSGLIISRKRGGTRANDDVSRYAVPRLMRELAGPSRSSHTFSYSGFSSLVNLSSGVIRWFLEPADRMYDKVLSSGNGKPVRKIPPSIQDEIMYQWSREFAERLSLPSAEDYQIDEDMGLHSGSHEGPDTARLHNLITALGLFFRKRLMDEDASEQRAFSVAVRGVIPLQVQQVLDYGERMGYLQRSDIAAKEAFAPRRPRYILARRLGPHFKLDVSGYAAHLSVTSEHLEVAISDPERFVKLRVDEDARNGVGSSNQLALMFDGEN